MKQKIYNLIILDESGSMSCFSNQTISGCNEIIQMIQSAQQLFSDTQEHFLSLYTFKKHSKEPSRYLIKNQPVEQVKPLTKQDYCPFGLTPLNDAIGNTLTD